MAGNLAIECRISGDGDLPCARRRPAAAPVPIASGGETSVARAGCASPVAALPCEGDPLTGLASRAALCTSLAALVAERRPAALVLIDIDDFGTINDLYGQDTGDAVLRHLACEIGRFVRPGTIAARIGDDEFAVLIPDIAERGALQRRLTALVEAARRPFVAQGEVIRCSATAAGCLHPDDGATAHELLRRVDHTLRAAKRDDRGGARSFDGEVLASISEGDRVQRCVRTAIAERLIEPHYQPQIDPASGRLLGVEALIRIRDRHGALLAPAAIPGAFQRADLAQALRSEMLRRIGEDLASLARAGLELGKLAINVSSAEIGNSDLPDELEALGLAPGRIEVEVTEDVMLGSAGRCVREALERIRARGMRIALDDFGTGFASLCHLRELPVDTIKIDRSFVAPLGKDRRSGAIIRAMLQLARDIELTAVVEGIETERQLRFVRRLPCTAVQGSLISPPVPAHELLEFAARGLRSAA